MILRTTNERYKNINQLRFVYHNANDVCILDTFDILIIIMVVLKMLCDQKWCLDFTRVLVTAHQTLQAHFKVLSSSAAVGVCLFSEKWGGLNEYFYLYEVFCLPDLTEQDCFTKKKNVLPLEGSRERIPKGLFLGTVSHITENLSVLSVYCFR